MHSANLAEIIVRLRSLIAQAQAGNWEEIEAQEPVIRSDLLNLDKLAKSNQPQNSALSADRSRLMEALALIDQAIPLIAERRDCIAPLIQGFRPASSALDK